MTGPALPVPSEVEGLTSRERAIWAAGFLLVAALLITTRFESRDPDSALYASISARLAVLPVSHWIAPYWWALWPGWSTTSLFREHPAGVFWLPAALSQAGIPAVQATYIVGIAAGLAALLLIARLVIRLGSRDDARAMLVLLQLMPVAFIFRIRGNHEYPMLVCLLLCLVGLEGLQRARAYAALVAAGVIGAVLIKGVFVVPVLIAGGLWIAIDPTTSRSRGRQIAAGLASLVLAAGVVVLYDALYRRVTGESFWGPYWLRQMAPVTVAAPADVGGSIASHLGYYLLRLAWHPAPWSLGLLWLGWRRIRSGRATGRRMASRDARALTFGLVFVAALVMLFSLPSRFAERYIFSATYVLGTCGALAAWRSWPRLRRLLTALDAAVPALPAVVWTVLMLLRLSLGPWLPRLQDH